MGHSRPTVAVESTLERDFALLQRFDFDVATVEEQPVRIEYGPKTDRHFYTPDFLVTYHSHDRIPDLVEVKYSSDPDLLSGALEPRFAAARAYARRRGWSFQLVTEVTIRTPYLTNATFLLPFRNRAIHPEQGAALANALSRFEPAPVSMIVDEAARILGLAREHLLPALWTMIANLDLETDLDQPLTMSSVVALPDGGNP